MKTLYAVTIAALLALVLTVSVQPPMAHAQAQSAGNWNIQPQLLTTTPTQLCAMAGRNIPDCGRNVWLCEGDVNAVAGTAATVTLLDGNGIPFISGVAPLSSSVASNYLLWSATSPAVPTDTAGCRFFPKGITMSASANTTIYVQMGGRY